MTKLIFGKINFYSLIYMAFFTLSSGFVLISSAATSESNFNLFTPCEQVLYKWKSSVKLNENTGNTRNIGFSLFGQVSISPLWGNKDRRLLKVTIQSLQLQALTGVEPQTSNINSYENNPFIISLNNGLIEKLFLARSEEVSIKNIKKGLASLLQLQPWKTETSETDVSGNCNTSYISESTIKKIKSSCTFDDFEEQKHLDQIIGFNVLSERVTEYTATESGLESIVQRGTHNVFMQANNDLGNVINTEQILNYKESQVCELIEADSIEEAIGKAIKDDNVQYEEETLVLSAVEETAKTTQFSKEVASLKNDLNTKSLGTIKSAKALLQLVDVARFSSSEDISKTLSSKKNVKILPQIYDILGFAQTQNSHAAVMKHLHLDNEDHTDLLERYLWALSFSVHPNTEILEDLLNKYKKYTSIPEKIRHTLVLTMSSMSNKIFLSKPHDRSYIKILSSVEEALLNGLDYAKDEDRYVYLNALKNLQSPSTLPKLVAVLQTGTLKEEVLAWRAIKSFGKQFWTPEILKQAEKTLFELDRKHDTSSRALAADLLLGAGASEETLDKLLHFVAGNATNFEIKQYIFQSIKMMSDKYDDFSQKVNDIVKNSKKLNNYLSLSPRGLSTALTRNIFKGESVNGSLISIQEIKAGIVKRGVVDVVLEKYGVSKDLFTLGIFAGGLSNFVSSGEDDNDSEDETSTAGMELTVMGTQIRPFVFFEGQGELMGHVWSGTASDMTPAFQALILIQDHKENLRLENGFSVNINLKGGVSFDLSGKIGISIWNRNAQSLIKKSIAYVAKGLFKIETPFVQNQIDFEGSIEPSLNLEIDADFSGDVKLCMKLSQPNSVFKQQITKRQAVKGLKPLKLSLRRTRDIPGVTYALNRKNNEMCSVLFS